jgi:hypothetical protein
VVTLRDAAQFALDYIRSTADYKMGHPPACEAAVDLADALAEPQQEPVAWGYRVPEDGRIIDCITPEEHAREEGEYTVPLYAAPQPKAEQQEPVAWHEPTAYGNVTTFEHWAKQNGWKPLYTAPQPRREVELTDEEIESVIASWWRDDLKMKYAELARAVIAAYRAKQGEQP